MEYKIDHIGYLTESIVESIKVFESIGYKGGRVYDDDNQRCRICFMERLDEIRVELVEPYEDNRTMQRMLKKQGNGPYHTCHIVDDINIAYDNLRNEGWYAMFEPVEAVAFDNRKICYFLKEEIGYHCCPLKN